MNKQADTSDQAEGGFFQKAKEAGKALGAKTKEAAQLTAKQAEKTKLLKTTLPHAYFELGKHAYSQNEYREQFPEVHQNVDDLRKRIKQAETADRPQAEGVAAKAKAATATMKDAATVKALNHQAKTELRKLGQAAYEKHGDQAGPDDLTQPIVRNLERVEKLNRESQAIDEAHSNQIITPKRIAIGAACVVSLLLAFGVFSMLTESDSERYHREQDERISRMKEDMREKMHDPDFIRQREREWVDSWNAMSEEDKDRIGQGRTQGGKSEGTVTASNGGNVDVTLLTTIRPGMTEGQVISILGRPHEVQTVEVPGQARTLVTWTYNPETSGFINLLFENGVVTDGGSGGYSIKSGLKIPDQLQPILGR